MSFNVKFLVRKNFIFTGDELSNILSTVNKSQSESQSSFELSYKLLSVKITDPNGKTLHGNLDIYNENLLKAVKEIKTKDLCANNSYYAFWSGSRKYSHNLLTKNQPVLVFEKDGDMAIRMNDTVEGDTLISILKKDDGFQLSANCTLTLE